MEEMTDSLRYLLHHGLCWRCVLLLYFFHLFFELKRTHILHPAQLVDLPQSELGLAQITQPGLAVVLGHVLIALR
jgi:hypothetical protein